MVLVYDPSSHHVLQLNGFHRNSFNGFQLTEHTRNCITNDQREITPKIYITELWFLYLTHSLIVRYNYMKFHPNSLNGFQLTERTRNYNYLCSMGNNSKRIQARVMVLYMTCHLIMFYNCMKFHPNSVNGIQSGHEIALQMVKGKPIRRFS